MEERQSDKMQPEGSCKSVLLVPSTAAQEPGIQEICFSLEDRLRLHSGSSSSQFQQSDWHSLLRVWRLHVEALGSGAGEAASAGVSRRAVVKALRLRSGWWGPQRRVSDAGLEQTLIRCALDTAAAPDAAAEAGRRLRRPGVFALRHRHLPVFGYVGRDAGQLFGGIRRLLCRAFDGRRGEDATKEASGEDEEEEGEEAEETVVAAALLLTRQADWQLTLVGADSEPERQAVQNELTLRHQTLWPRGLNTRLNQTLACLKELRELLWPSRDNRSRNSSLTTARRLGLADLQFDDVRRLVFDSDDSGLYRCDAEVREFGRLASQLRSRCGEEFRQVDFDCCHRLHRMAAALAEKEARPTEERLRYRRAVREHSGWWESPVAGSEQFYGKDSGTVANLDCLARTLSRKLRSSSSRSSRGGDSRGHGGADQNEADDGLGDYARLQTPGVFVLRHRSRPCWRYVSPPCRDVLSELRCLLHRSLDGFRPPPDGCQSGSDDGAGDGGGQACVAAALLLLSTADEWRFDLVPLPQVVEPRAGEDGAAAGRQLYNEQVLQCDALWPCGANLALLLDWRTLPALQASLSARRRSGGEDCSADSGGSDMANEAGGRCRASGWN